MAARLPPAASPAVPVTAALLQAIADQRGKRCGEGRRAALDPLLVRGACCGMCPHGPTAADLSTLEFEARNAAAGFACCAGGLRPGVGRKVGPPYAAGVDFAYSRATDFGSPAVDGRLPSQFADLPSHADSWDGPQMYDCISTSEGMREVLELADDWRAAGHRSGAASRHYCYSMVVEMYLAHGGRAGAGARWGDALPQFPIPTCVLARIRTHYQDPLHSYKSAPAFQ